MKHIKNLLFVVVAIVGLVGSVSVFGAGSLDGKVFEGAVGPKGEKNGKPEEISFKDGKFHSSACDIYGFGDGDYKATSGYGVIKFEADTVNDKGAKLHWKGKVKGDQIEATSVLNAPGEKPSESWAKGQLKK